MRKINYHSKEISIIIPVYNCENYITNTIKSIINQTISKQLIEIILINDGSTDDTLGKAQNILDLSGIDYSIITQKNLGVSYARNIGINNSKGKYIYFLDGDDLIKEESLETLYRMAENYKCDVVYGKYNVVNEKFKVIRMYDEIYSVSDKIESGNIVAKKMLKTITWIWTCSALYSSEIIKHNKIFFNTNVSHGEDTEFIIKVLNCAERVRSVNKVVALYLQRKNSVTNEKSYRHFSCISAYKSLADYLSCDNKVLTEIIYYESIPNKIIYLLNEQIKNKIPYSEFINIIEEFHLKNYFKIKKNNILDKKNIVRNIKLICLKWVPYMYYIYYKNQIITIREII